jgi:hypothetical protein
MIESSASDFFNMVECYQLADQLDPALRQWNQSKSNKDELNKSLEKSIDKKRKAKSKKNDSDAQVPKKSSLIHGPDSSHMTNECQTMHKQAYWMKEAWKNMTQVERSCQCVNNKNNKNRMNFMRWSWSKFNIDAGHV